MRKTLSAILASTQLASWIGGVLLVIADIVLTTLALARFQRTRLILD